MKRSSKLLLVVGVMYLLHFIFENYFSKLFGIGFIFVGLIIMVVAFFIEEKDE